MIAQQMNVDTIANNLANVNTIGFKKSRVNFQDLLYETVKPAGTETVDGTTIPEGIQIGHGVRPSSVAKVFSAGNLIQTGRPLDIAIEGDGFFKILLPNGEFAYTRNGSFKLDRDGRLVTPTGYPMDPEISIPEDTRNITISADGIVSVTQGDSDIPTEVGTIEMAKFINPGGLRPMGQNLYVVTEASGDEITGVPGEDGLGHITQGFLEMSNVNVVEEMVKMIISQRAYEMNSKAIQTADEMIQTVNQLKR